MKRIIAIVIAGLALLLACSDSIDGYGYAVPPTAFGSGSSAASSTGGSTTSGRPQPAPEACPDRPYCGNDGCCPKSWRCLRDRCVAPGIACASDADCSADRYCALALVEPRCFPRDTFCDDDAGARHDDCRYATCGPGPDVHLSQGTASCDAVKLYVYNFGRSALPPGAIIAIDQQPRIVDAGARDAGDAGHDGGEDAGAPVITTVIGETPDGILPGEVTLVRIPVEVESSRMRIYARVVHDAGAAANDCDPENDSDIVSNGCVNPGIRDPGP